MIISTAFAGMAALGRGCVKTFKESRAIQKVIKNVALSLILRLLHYKTSLVFAYGNNILYRSGVFTQPRSLSDVRNRHHVGYEASTYCSLLPPLSRK